MRVNLLVPGIDIIRVVVVLLESNELLEHNHTASVVEVVGWVVLVTLHSVSSSLPHQLDLNFGVEPEGNSHSYQQSQPEHAILSEIEVPIIVNGPSWLRPAEVHFISVHVVLKLDRIFRGHSVRVLVLVVQEVVDTWGMELSWTTQSITSNSASVFSGYSTSVVSEVINIIALPLFLKLSKSLVSV